MDDDPFHAYSDGYGDAIDDAIGFSHQGHEFFTRAKVRHLLRLVRAHVGPPADLQVLDLGCGPGVTDRLLSPHLSGLSGTDVSRPLLERATQDNPTVEYRHSDGARLPWPDDHFDVTFTICVLHHVEPSARVAFLQEMARVTRPGGLAVVFEHNPWNPLTRRAVGSCAFDHGVVLLSRPTLRRLAEAAGLEVVSAAWTVFVPFGDRLSDVADRVLGWLPLGGQYVLAMRPTARPRA